MPCHFPYGLIIIALKKYIISILGQLSARLPDCEFETLGQPTFFTKQCDTEDMVFATFLILDESEHQSVHSIFTDLANLQIISRHEISVQNTNVYCPPTVSQELVT